MFIKSFFKLALYIILSFAFTVEILGSTTALESILAKSAGRKPPFYIFYVDNMAKGEQLSNLLNSLDSDGIDYSTKLAISLGLREMLHEPAEAATVAEAMQPSIPAGNNYYTIAPDFSLFKTDDKHEALVNLIKQKVNKYSIIIFSGNKSSNLLANITKDKSLSGKIHTIILFDAQASAFNFDCIQNRIFHFCSETSNLVMPALRQVENDKFYLTAANIQFFYDNINKHVDRSEDRALTETDLDLQANLKSFIVHDFGNILPQINIFIEKIQTEYPLNFDFGCILSSNLSPDFYKYFDKPFLFIKNPTRVFKSHSATSLPFCCSKKQPHYFMTDAARELHIDMTDLTGAQVYKEVASFCSNTKNLVASPTLVGYFMRKNLEYFGLRQKIGGWLAHKNEVFIGFDKTFWGESGISENSPLSFDVSRVRFIYLEEAQSERFFNVLDNAVADRENRDIDLIVVCSDILLAISPQYAKSENGLANYLLEDPEKEKQSRRGGNTRTILKKIKNAKVDAFICMNGNFYDRCYLNFMPVVTLGNKIYDISDISKERNFGIIFNRSIEDLGRDYSIISCDTLLDRSFGKDPINFRCSVQRYGNENEFTKLVCSLLDQEGNQVDNFIVDFGISKKAKFDEKFMGIVSAKIDQILDRFKSSAEPVVKKFIKKNAYIDFEKLQQLDKAAFLSYGTDLRILSPFSQINSKLNSIWDYLDKFLTIKNDEPMPSKVTSDHEGVRQRLMSAYVNAVYDLFGVTGYQERTSFRPDKEAGEFIRHPLIVDMVQWLRDHLPNIDPEVKAIQLDPSGVVPQMWFLVAPEPKALPLFIRKYAVEQWAKIGAKARQSAGETEQEHARGIAF